MKPIKDQLAHIEKIEKTVEKIGTFLKTKRGQIFVKKLHTAPLNDLASRYNVPKFILFFKDNTKNYNMINSAIKQYNVDVRIPLPSPPKEITIKIEKYKTHLTAKEMKEVNSRRPKKLGFAALMHAYEEHKMEKFMKKHPGPTLKDLKEDLFPGELEAGYKTKLWIHREHVRNMLCKIHANIIPKERYYRVFKVYRKNTTRGSVISECEMDRPMIAGIRTTRKELREKLYMLAKAARDADRDVIKVKLYDKYGNLHLIHSFVSQGT